MVQNERNSEKKDWHCPKVAYIDIKKTLIAPGTVVDGFSGSN